MSNFEELSLLAAVACERSAGDTSDFEEVQTVRMPVIPSVSNEAMRTGGPEIPDGQLNAEEEEAAEENMKVYLKPVTYYSILQERATAYPSFLARGLCYKLQEKHRKKVTLSVSISGSIGNQKHSENIFPVYALLVRQVCTPIGETLQSSSYQFKKAVKLTADGNRAKFTLREIKKLSAVVKDGSFAILLVSCADHANPFEIGRSKTKKKLTQSYAGNCVMGKVPVEYFLRLTCETPNMSLGKILQSKSTVGMQSCCMKVTFPDVVTFRFPYNRESVHVPVVMTAEEVGAKAIDNNMLTNLLPPGLGLKPGEVTFKYKGYNNIVCMTEVMLDYSCPFCYLACASFKGLKCHLQASHDLFDYEFLENEKYKVVDVSCNKINKIDAFSPQICGILTGEDVKMFYRHKASTRTKIEEDQTQLAPHLGHVTLG